MKKLILLFCLISLGVSAQQKDSIQDLQIQDCNDKFKRAKPLFIVSGLTFLAGSAVTYYASTIKAPNPLSSEYEANLAKYNDRQKGLKQTTLFCYGLTGVFLISISIDF